MRPHVLLFRDPRRRLARRARAPAQQVADTLFDTSVARPMWAAGAGPRLVLDRAHFNFHIARRALPGVRRSRASRRLPRERGQRSARVARRVRPARDRESRGGERARPGDSTSSTTRSRRTNARPCAWVEGGGALLLVADHAPFGAATASLARAGRGPAAQRLRRRSAARGEGRRDDGALPPGRGLDTTHAIVRGRDASERVRHVKTFTGESIAGRPARRSCAR